VSKFIVVSNGFDWSLAKVDEGDDVAYEVINLSSEQELKSIARALNVRDEAAVVNVPALTATEERIQALADAGLDAERVSEEVEAYSQYKNSVGDYHFDYYEVLDSGYTINVCESLNSVDRYLDLIEEQAKEAGVL